MSQLDHRLAVYGTLAPGRSNHGQMAGMMGTWTPGVVRGRLVAEGWGATLGYPALVPDAEGEDVPVLLFESIDLPDHWARLDVFEGEGYRREVVAVRVGADEVEAWLYASASRESP